VSLGLRLRPPFPRRRGREITPQASPCPFCSVLSVQKRFILAVFVETLREATAHHFEVGVHSSDHDDGERSSVAVFSCDLRRESLAEYQPAHCLLRLRAERLLEFGSVDAIQSDFMLNVASG